MAATVTTTESSATNKVSKNTTNGSINATAANVTESYIPDLKVPKFDNKELINDSDEQNGDKNAPKLIGTDYSYTHTVLWVNASIFFMMHAIAIWGFILFLMGRYQWKTFFWILFLNYSSGEGITIGAHRYFTHKTFKASPGLKAVLVILQTLAGQNSIYTWVRDHRTHHRYSDTDADPHNAKRGFFFSHMGWLMCKKHPYVLKFGKRVDMSDLEADWMVMFQKKYFLYLYFVIGFFIPVSVPVYFWNERFFYSLLGCYFTRYVTQLNFTWLVNSVAHLYGTRPYDRNLQPVESWFVSMATWGEGWHNYHHAFPWDYKCAELSMHFNQSASIIRWLEKMGLAYDLKTASPEMVKNRIIRTGDNTHYELGTDEARAAVTAIGPVHPLNPFYNTTLKAPDTILKPEGLPLFHEKDTLNCKVKDRSTTAG